jgi:hypothetical protein
LSLEKTSGWKFQLFTNKDSPILLGYDLLNQDNKIVGALRILETSKIPLSSTSHFIYPKVVVMSEFFRDTENRWHQLATTRHTIKKMEINMPLDDRMEFDIARASNIRDLDNNKWIPIPK